MGKRIYFSLLAILFALHASAQPFAVPLKPLDHYFLDNKTHLAKGMNCMVITSQKQFDKLFGIAKTGTNKIITPDFSKQIVLLLAMPATNKETNIQFETGTKAGSFIEVNYTIAKKNYVLTYTMQPLALAIIPKYKDVNAIRFYTKSHLVKEVKFEKGK